MPKLPPPHPGKVLREQFLTPLGLSTGRLAKALHVPRTRIERLAGERVALSADTALRLARYFGTSNEFWIALKGRHERERAEDRLGRRPSRLEGARSKNFNSLSRFWHSFGTVIRLPPFERCATLNRIER